MKLFYQVKLSGPTGPPHRHAARQQVLHQTLLLHAEFGEVSFVSQNEFLQLLFTIKRPRMCGKQHARLPTRAFLF